MTPKSRQCRLFKGICILETAAVVCVASSNCAFPKLVCAVLTVNSGTVNAMTCYDGLPGRFDLTASLHPTLVMFKIVHRHNAYQTQDRVQIASHLPPNNLFRRPHLRSQQSSGANWIRLRYVVLVLLDAFRMLSSVNTTPQLYL